MIADRPARDEKLVELPETRRVERPRLVSRPLPKGWTQEGNALRNTRFGMRVGYDQVVISVEHHIQEQRSLLALLEWVMHQRAVEAQELDASSMPRGRVGGSEHEASRSADPRAETGECNSGEGSVGGVTAPTGLSPSLDGAS